jgi:hypothetical protein
MRILLDDADTRPEGQLSMSYLESLAIKSVLHSVRVVASAVLLAGVMALAGHSSSTARQTTLSATARPANDVSYGARGLFPVGTIVVRFVDTRRLVHFRGRRPQPRPLVTVIRYPAIGRRSRVRSTEAAKMSSRVPSARTGEWGRGAPRYVRSSVHAIAGLDTDLM